MKLLVEFELDESWEAYIPDNKEKLKAIIRSQLEGIKAKVVENLDSLSFPFNSVVSRWKKLAETKNNTVITNEKMLNIVISYNHNTKKFIDDSEKMHEELYG